MTPLEAGPLSRRGVHETFGLFTPRILISFHRRTILLIYSAFCLDFSVSFLLSGPFQMDSTSSNFVEDSLALELIDVNLYRSAKQLWHPPGARGIFGGAVIAQALGAALETVEPQLRVHSLHSYFVLA